jgi:pimeloyl-ACP methyl ester carboxylesterase
VSETRDFAERYYRSFDNLRLYYREYGFSDGARPALLCLPGLTRNCKDFHELALRYAGERRVLAPDYRGRGRSQYDHDPRRYTAEVSLDDTLALLDAAGVGRVVAIGTSMGGLIAMGMAVARPRALAGAVINDVGPDIELAGLRQIVQWVKEDRPQPDYDTAAHYLKTHAAQIGVRSDEGWLKLARNTWREGDDGQLHFDYDLRLVEPVAELIARGKSAPSDLWPLFGALKPFPALLLRGENSTVLSRETAAKMSAVKPDLRVIEVAGAGHAPQLDEPESLAAIDAFLAQI